jgi:hypothetical protein
MSNNRINGDVLREVISGRVRHIICVLSVTLLFFSLGCEESYKGAALNKASKKLVVFDVKGPGGMDFTKKLGTEFNGLGKAVVYGNQYGEPADSIAAAKIARDCGAQAFVLGEITQSGITKDTIYEIHGMFTLHDAQNGYQIGGVPDAHYSENINMLGGIQKWSAKVLDDTFKKSPQSKVAAYEDNLQKKIKFREPIIHQKLAQEVARELVRGIR